MRIRSRCHRCHTGIDLTHTGGPPPRLCPRCRRRLQLRTRTDAIGTRVYEALAGAVGRVRVTVGRRDRVVWRRTEPDAVTPAPDTGHAATPVVPSQGHEQ